MIPGTPPGLRRSRSSPSRCGRATRPAAHDHPAPARRRRRSPGRARDPPPVRCRTCGRMPRGSHGCPGRRGRSGPRRRGWRSGRTSSRPRRRRRRSARAGAQPVARRTRRRGGRGRPRTRPTAPSTASTTATTTRTARGLPVTSTWEPEPSAATGSNVLYGVAGAAGAVVASSWSRSRRIRSSSARLCAECTLPSRMSRSAPLIRPPSAAARTRASRSFRSFSEGGSCRSATRAA